MKVGILLLLPCILLVVGCLNSPNVSNPTQLTCEMKAKTIIPIKLFLRSDSQSDIWFFSDEYSQGNIYKNNWNDGSVIPKQGTTWSAKPGTETGQNVNLYYGRSITYGMGAYSPSYSKQIVNKAGEILGTRSFAVAEFVLEMNRSARIPYDSGFYGKIEIAEFNVVKLNIVNCNWVD